MPASEISALIDANFEDLDTSLQSCATADNDTSDLPEVRVCFGLACVLAGAEQFCEAVAATGKGCRIVRETCAARCWMAPVATFGDHIMSGMDEHWSSAMTACAVHSAASSDEALAPFIDAGGYGVLKSCLTKRRSIESVFSALSAFPLAAFEGAKDSIGIRMRELRASGDVTKLLLIIDERQPGIMNQAYLIERHTHSVLEGLLIAAWAIGAQEILVHCNSKYSSLRRCLERGLAALSESGLDRHVTFAFSEYSPERHNDAGLLQSLCCSASRVDTDREMQGCKPASLGPASVLIVWAELLRWIPEILAIGADGFCDHDGECVGVPILYSIAGRVASPGVYKAPAGRTINELIAMAGGIEGGYDFDSFVAGDWSNPALPAHLGNVRIGCDSEDPAQPARDVPIVLISGHDHVARVCAFRSDFAPRDRGMLRNFARWRPRWGTSRRTER